MKSYILILCITIAASSCSSASYDQIKGPDNQDAYSIKCAPLAINDCYNEATKLCPGGYSILDKGNSSSSMTVPMGSFLAGFSGPNHMLIGCKN